MAEKQRNIREEIDLTLQCLDGIKKAEANPFLYEKIMNKMNEKPKVQFLTRYKYALIAILVFLINLFTISYFSFSEDSSTVSTVTTGSIITKEDKINNLATEYSLTTNSYNY